MGSRARRQPEKWDKSSQKKPNAREFYGESGTLIESSASGSSSRADDAARKGDARNAQEREALMLNSTWRRSLAIGVFGVLGSVLAFAAGAKVGSKLDHQTRTVSVARVQIQELQQPQQAPEQVANK